MKKSLIILIGILTLTSCVDLPSSSSSFFSSSTFLSSEDISSESSSSSSDTSSNSSSSSESSSSYFSTSYQEYSIIYHLNGGSGVEDTQYNESMSFVLPIPTKKAYDFIGWYQEADFSDNAIVSLEVGSSGDKEFYAKWQATIYTITLNFNNNTEVEVINYSIESETIVFPVPNRAGFAFGGWKVNSDLSGFSTTQLPRGSNGNKIYYALWNIANYKITFILNGGAGLGNDTYTIEDAYELPTPTKNAHTFAGWFTNDLYNGPIITAIPEGSSGNKTFYAKWTVIDNGLPYYYLETPSISMRQVEIPTAYKALPAVTGDLNVLVIPVHFADSTTCATAKNGRAGNCVGVKEDIQKTFFGTEEETGWESLATYYTKSSYGKLNFSGKVADWYTSPKTSSQFLAWSGPNISEPSQLLLREAVEDYKAKNNDIDTFDSNFDNYIDIVYLVYDHAIQYSNWWAYKFHDYSTATPSPNNKKAYQYMFASMNFMYEDPNFTIDAHTFIHESGHLLNLDDYYSYDGNTSPLGSLDMQDMNIGDQCAYSKFLLDWIDPVVMWDSGSVVLRPFESSGDAVIIPASTFNDSAYDEFLMLEYITPTGLNYRDANVRYGGNYPYFYQSPGVRVTHIDARLAEDGGSGEYTDSHITNSYSPHSNTPSRSRANIALIQLISKNGRNYYSSNYNATSSDLFVLNDEFIATNSTFRNQFRVHNGKFNKTTTDIPYTFKITALNSSEVTIQFTKIL
jgi:M6 family metalloprotease-like protein/uncharacterized repeat protein (TIGR02543 family)